jgi:hypothetical protein
MWSTRPCHQLILAAMLSGVVAIADELAEEVTGWLTVSDEEVAMLPCNVPRIRLDDAGVKEFGARWVLCALGCRRFVN